MQQPHIHAKLTLILKKSYSLFKHKYHYLIDIFNIKKRDTSYII